jgi:hypothetical protein
MSSSFFSTRHRITQCRPSQWRSAAVVLFGFEGMKLFSNGKSGAGDRAYAIATSIIRVLENPDRLTQSGRYGQCPIPTL